MTNQEKFHDTISILVNAYLNDTLVHKACTACAVGNIIAAKNGFTLKIDRTNDILGVDCFNWKEGLTTWWNVVEDKRCNIYNHDQLSEGRKQIATTGYSDDQIVAIEAAFEGVPEPENKVGTWCKDDAYMLRGLMAVVDVLAEIHEIDLEQKESAKLMFVK